MGSKEPWKLVDYIKSFNYLNYDGGQFSTSLGRGCSWIRRCPSCRRLLALVAVVSHAPETIGQRIYLGEFPSSVNKDLADVLGNLCRG
jgi:methionyl-tRNA synthetase